MLSINISELLWTIINFFLLFFVLRRFLFQPLLQVMDRRREQVEAGLAEERQARETLQGDEEALALREQETRAEARRMLEEAAKAEQQQQAQALEAARTRAKEQRRETQARLQEQGDREAAALQENKEALGQLLAKELLEEEG